MAWRHGIEASNDNQREGIVIEEVMIEEVMYECGVYEYGVD